MINNWRKSSYSGTDGDCVEVGSERTPHHTTVGVRDTKSRDTGQLGFSGQAWHEFVQFIS